MHDELANEAKPEELSVHTMPLADLRSRAREANRLIDQARALARTSLEGAYANVDPLRAHDEAHDSGPSSAEDAARRAGALVDAAFRVLPGLAAILEDEHVRSPESTRAGAPHRELSREAREAREAARLGETAHVALRAMVAVLHSDAADEDGVQRALVLGGIDVEALLDAIERAELIDACAAMFRSLADAVESERVPSFRPGGAYAFVHG